MNQIPNQLEAKAFYKHVTENISMTDARAKATQEQIQLQLQINKIQSQILQATQEGKKQITVTPTHNFHLLQQFFKSGGFSFTDEYVSYPCDDWHCSTQCHSERTSKQILSWE